METSRIKEKGKATLSILAITLLGGLGLSACTNTHTDARNSTVADIPDETDTFKWREDGSRDTKSLTCVGDSLVYKSDNSFGVDDNDIYLNDPACQDGSLSSEEIQDYLFTQSLELQVK